jgi:CRISPR system Cascade subunit CasD
MASLLLNLSGPMQSWGVSSRFTERDTLQEPSKSGVVGLLCAAMGVSRDERELPIELSLLRMAVRVDQPGVLAYDYQTAQNVLKAKDGKVDRKDNTIQSWRHYLADARFTVGLQADHPKHAELLKRAWEALRDPRFPLSLGRRSYLPSRPIFLVDGFDSAPVLERLPTYPLLRRTFDSERRVQYIHQASSDALTYVIEAEAGQRRNDVLTGSFSDRRFGYRFVQQQSKPWGETLAPVPWRIT